MHIKKAILPVLKIWELQYGSDDYYDDILKHFYMSRLFQITNRFITCLSNAQLLMVSVKLFF